MFQQQPASLVSSEQNSPRQKAHQHVSLINSVCVWQQWGVEEGAET